MNVTVLAGGPDSERDVSLMSGRAVAAALKEAGHAVHLADVMPDDLSALDTPCDVIFPALHGAWGEGGDLQAELERRGLPFVGSGSAASRLGMDKAETKRAWQAANLPTPAFRVVDRPGLQRVSGSCVVKAVSGGSSIDCFPRKATAEGEANIGEPVSYLVAKYGRCMVEQMVVGHEVTVGILFDQPLPLIWVDSAGTDAGWFDYKAKYSSDKSAAAHRFDLPPVLDERAASEIQELCLLAHHAVGCRDLSRIDVMIDTAGNPYLLEINTMPGFTGRSLLPDAARQSGLHFNELCDRLVRAAASRSAARAA